MRYLLGADVGTTSLKMALFDENGREVKSFSRDYRPETVGERVELPAQRYWEMFSEGLDILSRGHKIHAVSIDTQCETLIVADEKGEPLRKAIVWLDNRAGVQAEKIERAFGAKSIYEITGQPEVTAAWPACKLLWIKENEPRVFKSIRKIFLLEDYLLYRLTGRYVTEKTLQSSSLYFDIRNGVWWKDMLELIGIKEELLPRILYSGEVVDTVGGMCVVAGAMDQVAGAIGGGIVKPGIVSETTGTAMVIFAPAEKIPLYNENVKIPCHINFNGGYCLLPWTPTAGIALKWFRDNFCEGYGYKEIDELCACVPPGSAGLSFLPYLCGSSMPKYNPQARGAFYGFTMEHTRAHAARSILESVACMLKSNLCCLDIKCDEIRSMGGGAESPLWCRIKADLTGKKIVTLKNAQAACIGSAILAGTGCGIFKSVEDACEKVVETGRVYEPQDTDYSDTYKRFCELEDKFV